MFSRISELLIRLTRFLATVAKCLALKWLLSPQNLNHEDVTRTGHLWLWIRHEATLFGAFAARFGAVLAVVRSVLFTFSSASLADHRAHSTNFTRETRITGHERGCQSANGCAFSVEQDAVAHHVDLGFVQTCCRAAVASVCAGVASGNTVGEWCWCHARRYAQSVPRLPRASARL